MTIAERIREFWPQTPATGSVIEIPDVGRDDLAKLFAHLRFGVGVEIGTERGLYAEVLCKANRNLWLWCFDPWKAYRGYREHISQDKLDVLHDEAQARLMPYNHCMIFRETSVDGSKRFDDECIDFIYIDGNHSLLHVVQDLCYWTPKIRSGGIVAGHDYIRRKQTGYLMHVPQALHAYCDAYDIKPLYILGTKAVVPGETRDTPRSWMFVKE